MLAEVIGTIRSRVSHFTNKFRELGFIEYQAGEELRVRFTSQHRSPRLDFFPQPPTNRHWVGQSESGDEKNYDWREESQPNIFPDKARWIVP
jgi:hypothetical protein